jgi:hypothetical protein
MVDIDNPVLDFSAMDRCSRCSAQAIALAQHEEHGEFLFCRHHMREHKDFLLDHDWDIIWDAEQLELLAR